MTTDISVLRRKRTRKWNGTEKATLVEVEDLLGNEDMAVDQKKAKLSASLDFLLEARSGLKIVDEEIADLIENDDEAEKDEEEAIKFNLKISTAAKKFEYFMEKQRREEESALYAEYRGFHGHSVERAESVNPRRDARRSRGVDREIIHEENLDDRKSWVNARVAHL